VRAKPPTQSVASNTWGVTPCFVNESAAVSPEGPAPMTIGLRLCSTGLDPVKLRKTSVVGDDVVDVVVLKLDQRLLEEQ
jgi:hypothetical protein